MLGRVVGHAVNVIVDLGDAIDVGTRFVVGDLTEGRGVAGLGGNGRGRRRHRDVIDGDVIAFGILCRLGNQVEVEARRLAPVRITGVVLGDVNALLDIGELVFDGQAVCIVLAVGNRRNQGIVCRLGDHDLCLVRRGVVGNARHTVVGLCDGVVIGALGDEGDVAEDRLKIGRILGHLDDRVLGRHRRGDTFCVAVIVGSKCEGEACGMAPIGIAAVVLGRLEVCLGVLELVGDNQAVLVVVLGSGGQLVVLALNDRHNHVVRCGVIRDASNTVIGLGDGVVIRASLLELETRPNGNGLVHVGCGIVLAHGLLDRCRATGHGAYGVALAIGCGRKSKGEAFGLAPVVELLLGFKLYVDSSVGVGNDQAVFVVVLHRCAQGVGCIIGLYDRNDHVVRRGVVRDAINAVIGLGDGVVVRAGLLKLDLVPNRNGLVDVGVRLVLSHRLDRSSRHRGLHTSGVGASGQREGEALRLAPVVELLGGLKVGLHATVGVGDGETGIALKRLGLIVVGSVINCRSHQLARGIRGHMYHNGVRSGVVGDAINMIVDLGDGVLVVTRGGVQDRAEVGNLCGFRRGLGQGTVVLYGIVFGHRGAIDGCEHEVELGGLAPFVEALGHLDVGRGVVVRVGDGQRAANLLQFATLTWLVVLDGSAQGIGGVICLGNRNHCRVHGAVIGYARNLIGLRRHNFLNRVVICSCLLIGNLTKDGLLASGLGCVNPERGGLTGGHRRGDGVAVSILKAAITSLQLKGKLIRLAPVVEALVDFELSRGALVGVGDRQALFTVIGDRGAHLVVGVLGHVDLDDVRGQVIGDAVDHTVLLCYLVNVFAGTLELDLGPDGNLAVVDSRIGEGDIVTVLVLGHGRTARDGRKQEVKAGCLAPILKLLGGLDLGLNRRIGVGNLESALVGVVLHVCDEPTIYLCHRDGSGMRSGVIGHTVSVTLGLGDGVVVGAFLVEGDVLPNRNVLFRIRGSVILGHDPGDLDRTKCTIGHGRLNRVAIAIHKRAVARLKVELEAGGSAPVFHDLGGLEILLNLVVLVGDGQSFVIAIIDRGGQGVGVGILDNRHDYCVLVLVIVDALDLRRRNDFLDRVGIGTSLLKGDVTKVDGWGSLRCLLFDLAILSSDGHGRGARDVVAIVVLGGARARRQPEREACGLAPIGIALVVLGCLYGGLSRLVGVGDNRAELRCGGCRHLSVVCIEVLDLCVQIAVGVRRNDNLRLIVLSVIGNTIGIAKSLVDDVVVSTGLLEGHGTKLCHGRSLGDLD